MFSVRAQMFFRKTENMHDYPRDSVHKYCKLPKFATDLELLFYIYFWKRDGISLVIGLDLFNFMQLPL